MEHQPSRFSRFAFQEKTVIRLWTACMEHQPSRFSRFAYSKRRGSAIGLWARRRKMHTLATIVTNAAAQIQPISVAVQGVFLSSEASVSSMPFHSHDDPSLLGQYPNLHIHLPLIQSELIAEQYQLHLPRLFFACVK